ncbi:MAG: hypothetical protein K2X03_09425 [Bryobacteraceae bacterium]|nr:hypothetical protein [Bryobacteraceae bacterium]
MGIDLVLRGRTRPGWLRRGVADLATMADWFRVECAAELESLDLDDNRILAWLHPAAESVELVAYPDGDIQISARTTPTGPGYHFYIARLLKRLGEEHRIEWAPPAAAEDSDASYDDTGFFFGAPAGEVYLHMDRWLATIAQLILDRADEGDGSFALGMPLQCGFAQLDFVNTPLGPRSRDWIAQVAAEGLDSGSRPASDFFPWPREGQDADYWRRRGLVLLWTQAVWRPLDEERERDLPRRIDAAFARAWRLDADTGLPWREWRELRALAGITGELDALIAEREASFSPDGPRIGYRRHDVVHRLMDGWSVRLPGSFLVHVEGDIWHARDGRRTIEVSLFHAGKPNEDFDFPDGPVPWTYFDESPSQSARAYLTETGPVHRLHGLIAAQGHFATVTLAFPAADTAWALGVWRHVRFLPRRDA